MADEDVNHAVAPVAPDDNAARAEAEEPAPKARRVGVRKRVGGGWAWVEVASVHVGTSDARAGAEDPAASKAGGPRRASSGGGLPAARLLRRDTERRDALD